MTGVALRCDPFIPAYRLLVLVLSLWAPVCSSVVELASKTILGLGLHNACLAPPDPSYNWRKYASRADGVFCCLLYPLASSYKRQGLLYCGCFKEIIELASISKHLAGPDITLSLFCLLKRLLQLILKATFFVAEAVLLLVFPLFSLKLRIFYSCASKRCVT